MLKDSIKRWPGIAALRRFVRRRRAERALRDALAAIAAFPAIKNRRRSGLPGELIISLTSYPARYATLANTLKSLIDQSIAADRLILWLAKEDVDAVPADVLALQAFGLSIRVGRDLKPANKIIHSLREFPEAFIVTADDDVYYASDWLERLVTAFDPQNPEIIAMRAHVARFGADGRALPYQSWISNTQETQVNERGSALFLTGVGGVLYPPGCMHPEVLNEDALLATCPRADDIWLYAMQDLIDAPRRRLPGNYWIVNWPSSQDAGLMHHNIRGDGNDRQMRAVQDAYPELVRKHVRASTP